MREEQPTKHFILCNEWIEIKDINNINRIEEYKRINLYDDDLEFKGIGLYR